MGTELTILLVGPPKCKISPLVVIVDPCVVAIFGLILSTTGGSKEMKPGARNSSPWTMKDSAISISNDGGRTHSRRVCEFSKCQTR